MAYFGFGYDKARNLAEFFGYEFKRHAGRCHFGVRETHGSGRGHSFGTILVETEKWCDANGFDITLDFNSSESCWSFHAWDADEENYTGAHESVEGAIYDAFIGL